MSGGSQVPLLAQAGPRQVLEPLGQAYGLMAGFGVQLWAMQDLHQLKALPGEGHAAFFANPAITQVFNVADFDAAQ